MDNCIIRRESPNERRTVENLIRESFWNVYRPGCIEHYVMHCLRNDNAFIPELNLVIAVRCDGTERIVGQIMCMNADIKTDDGCVLPIMTFGPISVHPDFQRRRYGRALLDHTMQMASEKGYGAVCIEGNIGFYGKSGFIEASSFGLRYHGVAEGEDASFFLCKELKKDYLKGVTGEYTPPLGYFIDEMECDAFDQSFPYKRKLHLPGQLF